jgi:hypothetical protein
MRFSNGWLCWPPISHVRRSMVVLRHWYWVVGFLLLVVIFFFRSRSSNFFSSVVFFSVLWRDSTFVVRRCIVLENGLYVHRVTGFGLGRLEGKSRVGGEMLYGYISCHSHHWRNQILRLWDASFEWVLPIIHSKALTVYIKKKKLDFS